MLKKKSTIRLKSQVSKNPSNLELIHENISRAQLNDLNDTTHSFHDTKSPLNVSPAVSKKTTFTKATTKLQKNNDKKRKEEMAAMRKKEREVREKAEKEEKEALLKIEREKQAIQKKLDDEKAE